jgi:hypothetical protein
MKIEYIGLKPDCRQSSGQGVTMMGQAAHGGGRAAYSGGCSRPALSYVVLHLLLPEFHDFRDRILFCYRGVSPPTLVSYISFCTTCGDKHISKNRDRE